MHTSETADAIQQVLDLLRTLIYAPAAGVTAQTRLADLGLDSLESVEVGLELEALLGCELPEDAFHPDNTVADLAAFARGRRPAPRLALAA